MWKIGIIGCGKIAQVRHIPEYIAEKDVLLYGLYDRTIERMQSLAKKYGARTYNSVTEMLSDKNIDAVSICSANYTHHDFTIAALKAGKHVLCEKPMATTLTECENMVAVAKETGKLLMIGHNQRFTKTHAKARQLIADGMIGKLITFRTSFGHRGPEFWSINPSRSTWFFDKKFAAMGAIGDLGIHKTDLIQFLTGSRVKEVFAKVTTLDKKDSAGKLISVDDNALCVYTMENGITGTMTASWTFYGEEDNSTILYGTHGIMHIYDNPDYSIKIITRDGDEIIYQIDKIQTNDRQTISGVITTFIDSLRNNTEPEISGEVALSAMRAVFSSIKSSETGKKVTING